MVEQLICNQRVGGSSPSASSDRCGQVPKWSNGAGCKPAAATLRRFESFPAHLRAGIAQLVEHRPSKPSVAGSSPVSRSSYFIYAHVAQQVEHVLGKDGVTSSSLVVGSFEERKNIRAIISNSEIRRLN